MYSKLNIGGKAIEHFHTLLARVSINKKKKVSISSLARASTNKKDGSCQFVNMLLLMFEVPQDG